MNPGGSIKDRTALTIIQAAINTGELGSDRTLLDATSGHTGITYALLGAALGIPIQRVGPGRASPERLQALAASGAELILSDPYDGSDGAIRLARSRWQAHPDRYFYADQYTTAVCRMVELLATLRRRGRAHGSAPLPIGHGSTFPARCCNPVNVQPHATTTGQEVGT